ncbi:hypothetical protein A1O1_02554 [Capronia coronata CBS 617.96]|uniref:Uncharacterized protein n=1 Tax=Capronia coronata CBS 617.96 TaxID=1182541 RepID=W9YY01_9EURO|nr:uncharacterized protein A1O1_02554 [Capronia coronata CBS 617.96]EXJ94161.1 hypothetical protein A1O1_02554 [Capronia coronata CBS 617.96]
MFAFCIARITTTILRIVWAVYPTDASIRIAATIFVALGVLVLFLINLIFAQRVIRATHPHFGWHKSFYVAFKVLHALIIAMIPVVVTGTVQSFYTLNVNTHRIDRDLQMTGTAYFLLISFLPMPMVILALVIPRKTRLEKFGSGRWRTKIAILLTSSALLCLGAAFRAATTYENPRLLDDPAWYDAKWCFYFFNFILEILVIYMYLIVRVDRRFWVPDGSKGPGDYLSGGNKGQEKQAAPEDLRRSSSRESRCQNDVSLVERSTRKEFDSEV